ncbi:MAG: alcohol dehydrogenase catalytic domain-containing protein [Actinomycetota bacterium]|nr:alcohol dehydrogenase catalytic domain-containing protein [Actinomycetota bacterium]
MTVTALRIHGPGDLRLHEEPDPAPGDGEVLVEVTAVGLCGSDRHWYLEGSIGDAGLDRPLVLGHEFAGVLASGPDAGLRVALEPAVPCGACGTCRAGLQHLCLQQRFAGHGTTDGALRTRLAWPRALAFPLPDDLPDVEAALLEPLGVALHALDLGHVRAGTAAAVLGCGPIGLLTIQALHAAGVEVALATDPLAHRRAAAARLGALAALAPGDVAAAGPFGELGVDVAFETSGEDDALADAADVVRPAGRVVLVGIPDGDRTSFPASTARRKGLTLLVSRRMRPGDLERAIRLARTGHLHLAPLVTERHPLAGFGAAFASLAGRRGLKVVIEPQADRPVAPPPGTADPAGPADRSR